jgi:arsenate reductase
MSKRRLVITAVLAGQSQSEVARSYPAAQVLAERGLPVEDHVPTLLTVEGAQEADVVAMGCGETCPVFTGKRYEGWTVDDPKDQPLDLVRAIVDDIDARLRDLVSRL